MSPNPYISRASHQTLHFYALQRCSAPQLAQSSLTKLLAGSSGTGQHEAMASEKLSNVSTCVTSSPPPRTAYTNSIKCGRVGESYGLHCMPNARPRGAIAGKATRSRPAANDDHSAERISGYAGEVKVAGG
jgi:hypothetical protein